MNKSYRNVVSIFDGKPVHSSNSQRFNKPLRSGDPKFNELVEDYFLKSSTYQDAAKRRTASMNIQKYPTTELMDLMIKFEIVEQELRTCRYDTQDYSIHEQLIFCNFKRSLIEFLDELNAFRAKKQDNSK